MTSLLLSDSLGLAIGIALGVPWIMLPGAGLALLMDRLGLDCGRGWQRLGWALILAFTLLPAIDALLVRAGGMGAMAALHLLLGIVALTRPALLLPTGGWRIAAPLLLLWLLIVGFDFVDFVVGGALNQSLLDLDLVKHAAVTSAIAHQGLPFADPFFARPGFVGYYYYFYLWPAAIQWSSGFAANARMAFAAAAFWAGLAFPALMWRIASDAGLINPGRARRFMGLILLFCFVSGVDLLIMVARVLTTGAIEAQSDWWNTEIVFALRSILWVPHHMTAMIAAWGAMLVLARARDRAGKPRWSLAAIAGLGIATCFGSSVWLMLTVAPVLIGWGCVALWRRDWTVPVAGIVALLAASVQIADLMAYRDDSGLPIAFAVRPFTVLLPEGGGWAWFHLAALPLSYAMEFGIFAWGTIMWWRNRADHPRTMVHRLLIASTLSSLLIASFLKSTIINNDLAWRSIWFAQVAAILWTAAWAQAPSFHLRDQMLSFRLLLALGIAAVAWDVLGLRLIRPPYFDTSFSDLISPRVDDDDQRRLYEWAAAHLPESAVIQHNPALHRRIFNFGLYGVQRTGVADREANLFGAPPAAVAQRIAVLAPIYDRPLPPADIAARARTAGVDYLIFASIDPIWAQAGGPPRDLHCIARQPLACLISVAEIDR